MAGACMQLPYNADHFLPSRLLLFSCYKIGPTHAVIQFDEEDTTAVVPLKKILLRGAAEQVKLGCSYDVKWTDSKIYKATVHALGICMLVHELYYAPSVCGVTICACTIHVCVLNFIFV